MWFKQEEHNMSDSLHIQSDVREDRDSEMSVFVILGLLLCIETPGKTRTTSDYMLTGLGVIPEQMSL